MGSLSEPKLDVNPDGSLSTSTSPTYETEHSRKQLAAGTKRCVLHGLPPFLAKDDAAVRYRWDLEPAAGYAAQKVSPPSSFAFESVKERNAGGVISEMVCHRPSIKCRVASLSGEGANELPSR